MILTIMKRFVLPVLSVMLLLAFRPATHGQVDLKAVNNDYISVTINGEPFANFYIGKIYPKPFLAPLRSAAGLIVTRRYPLENVEGESRDHPHHRGLFVGFGDVNGINFWENEPDSKVSPENPAIKGTLVLKNLDDIKSGKKSGTISAVFDWRGPDGIVLEEKRVTTFYADRDVRSFDVDETLTAKTKVRFGDTKEGFFAIRLADSMAGKNGGIMTNSEGAQTETNVWGKRADWVDYDGTVDGQKVGVVIFDHPKNPNHPPRWHARDYGLFAVNPFGLKEFDKKSAEQGGLVLPAGDSLYFRYRVVIHPGDYPKQKIADLYSEYVKKSK